jgi:hypothetical protein
VPWRMSRPLAAGTVHRVRVVLHRALAQAVRWVWIWLNPASHASRDRVNAADRPPTPTEEQQRDDPRRRQQDRGSELGRTAAGSPRVVFPAHPLSAGCTVPEVDTILKIIHFLRSRKNEWRPIFGANSVRQWWWNHSLRRPEQIAPDFGNNVEGLGSSVISRGC